MPVAGLVKLRKHLFGRQLTHGTKVAATRAYPVSGVPDVDLGWTDPEIDAGTIDPTAAPYRTAGDLTADLSWPALDYNSLPLILSGFFGGGVTPTGAGTSKTWDYAPASDTVDDIDEFTYGFGDDVLTDWYQFGDGIIESFEINGAEATGPMTASAQWRFGSVSSTGSTDSPVTGTVPTAGLAVEVDGILLYLKDLAIYIASDPDDLETSQIEDALHTFVLRGSGDVDQKRYANGDQTFDIDAYARASRLIELEATWAKTSDIVGTGSEADAWMSDAAVTRYVMLRATATAIAETGTPDIPYSFEAVMPMRYYTRTEGEEGGNSTVILTGHAFFEPTDFDGVFTATVVNTLTAAQLGATV